MKKSWLVVCCLIAGACSAGAFAHSTSTSYLDVSAREDGPVPLRWDLSVHDLAWSVFIDADYDGLATWREIQAARTSITRTTSANGAMSGTRSGRALGLPVKKAAAKTTAGSSG